MSSTFFTEKSGFITSKEVCSLSMSTCSVNDSGSVRDEARMKILHFGLVSVVSIQIRGFCQH